MGRKVLLLAGVIALLTAGASWAQSGFGLCIRPGMVINAVQFGYKAENLFAGVGLEFASLSWSTKEEYKGENEQSTYTQKIGANVFLPQMGIRYSFRGANEEDNSYATPYLGASLFYSLGKSSITESDGQTTYRDTTTEKLINDALTGNIGGTVGVGGEYYFSRQFSIGGEFGVRFLFGGTKNKVRYYSDEYTLSNNLGLGVTYTTLGLNFYF